MDNNTFKSLLYKTIHRNKKPIALIADETGISANYLYRAGLPLEDSGVKLPCEYLVPLMNSTKDYSVLNHLANICGFLLVKIPRIARNKKEEIEIVDEFQQTCLNAQKSLMDFFKKMNNDNYAKASEALLEVMTKSASAKKSIDKAVTGQLELEL